MLWIDDKMPEILADIFDLTEAPQILLKKWEWPLKDKREIIMGVWLLYSWFLNMFQNKFGKFIGNDALNEFISQYRRSDLKPIRVSEPYDLYPPSPISTNDGPKLQWGIHCRLVAKLAFT